MTKEELEAQQSSLVEKLVARTLVAMQDPSNIRYVIQVHCDDTKDEGATVVLKARGEGFSGVAATMYLNTLHSTISLSCDGTYSVYQLNPLSDSTSLLVAQVRGFIELMHEEQQRTREQKYLETLEQDTDFLQGALAEVDRF